MSNFGGGFGSAWGQPQQQQQQYQAPQQNFGNNFTSGFNRQVQNTVAPNTFGQGYGQPQQQQQQQQQPAAGSGIPHFFQSGQWDATLTSHGHQFNTQSEYIDVGKSPGNFHNIRITPLFQNVSTQMLKLLDMQAMAKNGPQPNYENLAGVEYQLKKNQYALSAKLGQNQAPNQPQTPGFGAQPQQQTQGGWPIQNSSFQAKPLIGTTPFGGTSTFGQPQQPQQQTTPLFGGASSFGQKLAFGQNASSPFGQTAFGAPQQQQQQQSAFGIQQQPQQQSLFGGKPATTPLFGQPQQQQQPLFGQTQPTQTPTFGSGLFGQQQQQPTQGLFGAQQQQPSLQLGASGQNTGIGLGASGSLFGGAPKTSTPSFFGGSTTNPSPLGGTSLFGGGALNKPAGQGLFGQTSQPASGLFGAQPLGGAPSAFGAQPQTQQPSGIFGGSGGTSIFGSGAPTSGGLFGQAAQQQPNSGLFSLGGQGAAPGPQQLPAPLVFFNPYGDLTKSDPYGGKSNYINSSVSPLANAEDELKKIHDEIFNSNSSAAAYKDVQPLSQMRRLNSLTVPGIDATSVYLDAYEDVPQVIPTFDEKVQSVQDRLTEKYRRAYQSNEVVGGGSASNQNVFNAQGTKMVRQPSIFGQSSYYNQPVFKSQNSFGTDTSLQISRQSSIRSEYKQPYSTAKNQAVISVRQNNNPDQLFLTFNIPQTQDSRGNPIAGTTFELQIHKTRHLKDVHDRLDKFFKGQANRYEDLEDFKVVLRNQIISVNSSLAQAGITGDTTLDVFLQMKAFIQPLPQPRVVPQVDNSLKAPKAGYQTQPSFDKLKALSEEELREVRDFAIWNNHGKVQFSGPVDLTHTNLAEVVSIDEGSIEVYPDSMKATNQYPSQGQKLNHPATLCFFNVKVKGANLNEKVAKLKKAAERIGAQHVSFNEETLEWHASVPHFTRYKLGFDNDEEDEGQAMQDDSFQGAPVNEQISDEAVPSSRSGASNQLPSKFHQPLVPAAAVPSNVQLIDTSSSRLQQVPSFAAAKPHSAWLHSLHSVIPGDVFLGLPKKRANILDELEAQSVQSSVIRGEYRENEPMVELANQREPITLTQSRPIDQSIQMKFRAEEILMKIAKKDSEMARTGVLYKEKRTIQESLKYLQDNKLADVKQVRKDAEITGFKNTPMKVRRFRPQFRPDGALLTLKKSENKLVINEVKIVKDSSNSDQKRVYEGLTDVFKKHTIIDQKADVQSTFGKMHIDQQIVAQIEASNDVNMRHLSQRRHHNFDDASIQHMLSESKLPFVDFKKEPHDMFFFYEDLALAFIKQLQDQRLSPLTREKLTQEFYVVCTLNALFGNPNIHLIQKHPDFKQGPNTYDKARARFSQNFVAGASLENEKKRKNALTEVLRFICLQEQAPITYNPPLDQSKPDSKLYHSCLEMLLNGSLKKAVEALNKADKKQMAHHVMSCVNNPLGKKVLGDQLKNKKFETFTPQAKELVKFMAGEFYQQLNAGNPQQSAPRTTWTQALTYQLLIIANPQDTLQETISEFEQSVYARLYGGRESEPLLWLIIKFYALSQANPQLIRSICNFSNTIVYPGKPDLHVQDYRVNFLVSLSLHNFLYHHEINKLHYSNQFNAMSVTNEELKRSCLSYMGQLMRMKDWEQALFVASHVPYCYAKLRKHLAFSILIRNAAFMLRELSDSDKQSQYQSLVCKTLHVPKEYLFAGRAMLHQSLGNHESAMMDWKQAENMNMAHEVFMQHVAPVFFSNVQEINQLIPTSTNFNPALKELLQAFEIDSQKILNWKGQGSLIRGFLQILSTFKSGDDIFSQCIQLEDYRIFSIARELFSTRASLSQPHLHVIHRYIWDVLLRWERVRAIKRGEKCLENGQSLAAVGLSENLLGQYKDSPQLARVFEELAQTVSTWHYNSNQLRFTMRAGGSLNIPPPNLMDISR